MPTYRHNRYKRLKLGPFEFVNGICSVPAERDEEFRNLVLSQSPVEAKQIVEINEAALRNLERPVVDRGAKTAASSPKAQTEQATALAVRRATQDSDGEAKDPEPVLTPQSQPSALDGLAAFRKESAEVKK